MRSVAVTIGTILLAGSACAPNGLAASAVERSASVQKALAYLYRTRHLSGNSSTAGNQGATGLEAFAFLNQRDEWGENGAEYEAAVDQALTYLISSASVADVSTRNDGIRICPEGNSSCKAVFWDGNGDSTQTTGLIAPAVAAYALTIGLDTVATRGGPLAGMTWRQISQGITNALAAGQNTAKDGNRDGRWGSRILGAGDSSASATAAAVSALLFDEMAGAATPDVIKEELKVWLANVRGAGGADCDPVAEQCDVAETGAWLLALTFVGQDLTNPQFQSALAFLNTRWRSSVSTELSGNFGQPYGMWTVYQALTASVGRDSRTRIVNLLTDCGVPPTRAGRTPANAHCTWWGDYSHWLTENQKADGSWAGYSRWNDFTSTALYLNILGGAAIPMRTYKCPLPAVFWKAAPDAWPLDSLNLGGQKYRKEELFRILSSSIDPDTKPPATSDFAAQLIAAKLNLAHGSSPAPIAAAIVNSDKLLRASGAGALLRAPLLILETKFANYSDTLRAYNSDSLTASCTAAPGPGAEGKLAPIAFASASTPSLHPGLVSGTLPAAAPQQPGNSNLGPRRRKGVTSMSLKADGRTLATASTDNTVRIWSVSSGLQQTVLKGSLGLLEGVVFSPSGSILGSVGQDSLVRIWDTDLGTQLAKLSGHEQGIRAIAASPDGRLLASAGEDSRILLWDPSSRKLKASLFGARSFVNALSFSPDSRFLAAAGEDARVLIFDVTSGKSVFTLRGHSGPVDTLAFSPDGTMLASAGTDAVIHIWNPVTGLQRLALKGQSAAVRAIAFSPNSLLIASGGESGQIILWNTTTGAVNRSLTGSASFINALVFDPMGRFLAGANEAGQVTLWNVISGAQMLTFTVP